MLSAAAVIEPQPLSPGVAADYLQACLSRRSHRNWPAVLDALRTTTAPALAEVASTPLGLWLVRATYIAPGKDPSPLLDLGRRTAPELTDHLCDQLIPALVGARPPADAPAQPFRPQHAWNPEQVDRWLTYLSRQLMLSGEDTHDVAWWHLARYTPSRWVRLAVSLACGLVVAVVIGMLTANPLAGAVTGILSGLVIMVMIGSWFTESPGYADFQLKGRLPLHPPLPA